MVQRQIIHILIVASECTFQYCSHWKLTNFQVLVASVLYCQTSISTQCRRRHRNLLCATSLSYWRVPKQTIQTVAVVHINEYAKCRCTSRGNTGPVPSYCSFEDFQSLSNFRCSEIGIRVLTASTFDKSRSATANPVESRSVVTIFFNQSVRPMCITVVSHSVGIKRTPAQICSMQYLANCIFHGNHFNVADVDD